MSTYLVWPRNFRRMRRLAEPAGFNGGRRLPLDVRVSDEAYEIIAAVPGLTSDDLTIEILDDVVTLRAEVEVEESGNGQGRTLLHEIPQASDFARSLRLPEPIDPDKAEAKVENGLLTVRIPKAEEARPKRIKVQTR